ncbi:MAG: hypothetical protein ACRBFS_21335 [Aureispira sp.]
MTTTTYKDYQNTLILAEEFQPLRALEAAQDTNTSETFDTALEQELNQHDFILMLFGCSKRQNSSLRLDTFWSHIF